MWCGDRIKKMGILGNIEGICEICGGTMEVNIYGWEFLGEKFAGG